MDSSIAELVSSVGITTALVIGVFWFAFTRWFDRQQTATLKQLDVQLGRVVSIDESLRDKRQDRYAELWKASGMLPLWPRAELTRGDLYALSVTLKRWYFEIGGMYLSHEARTQYTPVQAELSKHAVENSEVPVTDDEYDAIRAALSALRTELTNDLDTRVRRLIATP